MHYFAFILILLQSTYGFAAPQYRRDCTATFIPNEGLETALVPEALRLTELTGLRVMELKTRVVVPGMNFPVGPSSNESAKFEQARKLAAFLQTFPLAFLRSNPDLCFVLTDRMSPYGAIAVNNVMLIPIGAPLDTIAHEMSHAIDNLHLTQSKLEEWLAINSDSNCTYQHIENPSITNLELRDINSCFPSQYAQRNRSEDRAEVFAAMVQDYNNLVRKTPENSALTLKIRSLKQFYNAISPEMNDSFWVNRPSFNHVGQYNSCGSSVEEDPSCRFDRLEPLNRFWDLDEN